MKNEEEYLAKLIGDFFHEIVEPMKSIEMELGKLLSNNRVLFKYNNRTASSIYSIERSVNQTSSLIGSFYYLIQNNLNSNFDSDSNREQFYNLNTIIEIALFQIRIDNPQINFNCQYSSRCNVLCYRNEIVQVVVNIIKNAVEAFSDNQQKRMILIKTKVRNENDVKKVSLEILNNGHLIPIGNRDKIFNRGFSTKSNNRGIGLSLVKKFITKNNAEIVVQSPKKELVLYESEKWTSFLIKFENI